MNGNLTKAKKAKNDEFYTRLTDIEKELMHYKEHFRDKVVFCNCDDPEVSNFWKYFKNNFHKLGLKKLITTHYAQGSQSYKLEFAGRDVVRTPLAGDGDFRSPECLAILDESDVVVTNPPFSLFREYVAQLVDHNKRFLIIGNNNAITYKEIFRLIKDNKLWMGFGVNKTVEFQLADDYQRWDRICTETKKKFGKVPAISWFTNLKHDKRSETLTLWKTYKGNESLYPKYDNYDAIEVSKVADIPVDYHGAMGVPITFLDKYNPEQFGIMSSNDIRLSESIPFKEHGLIKDKDGTVKGQAKYVRIVIKRISNEN